VERGICPIAPLALRLTLYSLTGSRVWRIGSRDVVSQMVLSYWWSVDAKLLSRTVAEILSLKHFGITNLTLSDQVTSSVMWPLEPQLVISYWSSVDTMSLYHTIAEILSIKNNWVTSLTPRCHVTGVIGHVTIGTTYAPFLLVVCLRQVTISHSCRDIAPQTLRITTLTLLSHVMSSVTWPLEPHMVLSYWWSVDTKSLSRTVAEILSIKHFEVMTLTLSGHVTSSIMWPLESQMVLSYWRSVDTKSLSRTVTEILSVIIWITIFPL